jgi:hypothetical protein
MTLPALALAVGATVPAASASATAANASTPPPYQLTGGLPAGAKMLHADGETPRNAFGGNVANGIPNLDTIPNFSGHFNVKGLNRSGQVQNQWLTNFVGALPQHGGTTAINAPIIPVTVQLLGQNGQVFYPRTRRSTSPTWRTHRCSLRAPGRAVRLRPNCRTRSSAPSSSSQRRRTGIPSSRLGQRLRRLSWADAKSAEKMILVCVKQAGLYGRCGYGRLVSRMDRLPSVDICHL